MSGLSSRILYHYCPFFHFCVGVLFQYQSSKSLFWYCDNPTLLSCKGKAKPQQKCFVWWEHLRSSKRGLTGVVQIYWHPPKACAKNARDKCPASHLKLLRVHQTGSCPSWLNRARGPGVRSASMSVGLSVTLGASHNWVALVHWADSNLDFAPRRLFRLSSTHGEGRRGACDRCSGR